MLRGIWLRCWCTIWEFGVCDDYENINHLLAKNEIDEELAQNLKRLNGMKNAVVHRYGTVNIELIFENIEEIKRIFSRIYRNHRG
jgi:uncharacterized protein YutE (UPF0331/DUF86 family)